MAYRTYISISGKDQKQFKAESKKDGRKDKWIEVVDHEWRSSVGADSDSGAPKGHVKMKPLYITKEKGASSPQIMQSHFKGEVLDTVIIEEVGRTEDGKKETVMERITMTDAVVVDVYRFTQNPSNDAREHDLNHLEKIGFRARKVQIENVPASTSTTWDWNEPGS